MVKYLEVNGAFIISSSGVFSRAAKDYRSIFDPSLNKAYKIGERRKELNKILAAILLATGVETTKKKGDLGNV